MNKTIVPSLLIGIVISWGHPIQSLDAKDSIDSKKDIPPSSEKVTSSSSSSKSSTQDNEEKKTSTSSSSSSSSTHNEKKIVPLELEVGLATSQGRRAKMEDRHCIEINIGTQKDPILFYAVYDGNGGRRVAHYLATFLHEDLKKELASTSSIEDGIKKAFSKVDAALLEKKWEPGSTACCCLVTKNYIYTANVGDSRAVVCKNGKALPLSLDHKPLNPTEKERIEKAGGTIHTMSGDVVRSNGTTTYIQRIKVSRINGTLALSRAFGRYTLKKNGKLGPNADPSTYIVTSEPDITITELTPETEFIVIASDGLWDVFSNEETIVFIKKHINEQKTEQETEDKKKERKGHLSKIAKELISAACSRLSTDNITVIIIPLNLTL
jgi:protein phosphatase PTC2/3